MRVRSLATAAAFVGLHDASANPSWPAIAKGTDMSNPANWPNDPGYTTDWNYWSWLPKKVSGARAYVPADVKLAASGMHIDQAWTYTTGRPDVKIAIIDCGIEWDHSDLANKEYLSAAELSGAHQPQNAMGVACPAVSSTLIGRKVPAPTCSVIRWIPTPRSRSAVSKSGVKCRPAVGAATAPSLTANMVW